ncbi:fibronectin type III domain-containing protein, partial [Candidatus Nitrosotalea okcheonensis]|uniref:fibronectin type III domain-containing protein n=1 Tax=Candidatus Nitrosotalea okcheonensis TaxID=1903276 RepID=UPI0018D52C61
MSKNYGKKIDNKTKIITALFFGFLLLSSSSAFTSGASAQLGSLTNSLTSTSGLTSIVPSIPTPVPIPVIPNNPVIPVLPSPTGLTASAVSSSQISLNWNASSISGSLVAGYMIERSQNNGITWSTIQSNTGTSSTIYLDSGLSPSTTYTYRVSAVYDGGLTSSPSNTASATTQSNTSTLTVSTQLITGDTLTGMYTELRNSTGQIAASSFSPATFVLKNGAQYTVGMGNFVTYIFDHWADTGSTTNPRPVSISSDTQLTAIYRDIGLVLSPSRGPAGTTVSVTGANNAYSPSTAVTLRWDGTALATITSNSTGGFSATFQVPSTATAGSHKVQATDGTHTHAALFIVGPNGPTTPQPPTSLTATTISSSQINLSWTAPSDNGGSAITGYKIERSQDNRTTWSIISSNTASTSTTYSDTGLSPSTAYAYRVSAINSVGTSVPSNIASATTQNAATLLSPTGLTASAVSSSQISLNWNAPSNSGSLVTGYMIERSSDGGITWSTKSNTGTSSTIYLDSGLSPSTTYTYRVSAMYGAEASPPSNTASATTQSSTYKLTVSTQLSTGDTLTGMYTELRNSTGQIAAS